MCVTIFFVTDVLGEPARTLSAAGMRVSMSGRNRHHRPPLPGGSVFTNQILSTGKSVLPRLLIYSRESFALPIPRAFCVPPALCRPSNRTNSGCSWRRVPPLASPLFWPDRCVQGLPCGTVMFRQQVQIAQRFDGKRKCPVCPSERVATVDRPMPAMTLCRTLLPSNRHCAGRQSQLT